MDTDSVYQTAIKNVLSIYARGKPHMGIDSPGEDTSRIRVYPYIFAKLRCFALNILRHNHLANISLERF